MVAGKPLTEDQKRKKREKELIALLLFLRVSLEGYARKLIAGEYTEDVFLHYAMSVIVRAHMQAAVIGTAQAGGFTYNSWTVGNRAAQSQKDFMAAFARDLANGRYDPKRDGGEGAAARSRRFDLYALRLTGTANQAMWAAVTSQRVRWVLGPNEDHCPDCPKLAARGWMPRTSLHQWPGDGHTECLVLCKCHLEFSDGLISFSNNP